MSRVNPSRDAHRFRGRIIGFLFMLCALSVLATGAMALHQSHRAIQRDEDILTGFRSEFEAASDDTLRQRAEQRGAMLLMASNEQQYLFRIRRDEGPWNCTGVDVTVAVSAQAHAGKRDVRLQRMPVDCR
ncbi:MAG TPA: hypothetical protein VIM67_04495 [Terriglobus sp.]